MKTVLLVLIALSSFVGVRAHSQSTDEMVKIIIKTENGVLVQANKDGPKAAVEQELIRLGFPDHSES